MSDTEFCSACGMSLNADGKCSGCDKEPDMCSCQQSAGQPK